VARALDRKSRIVLLALVLFAVFFRLATLMMMNTGVDERDYWFSAKALSHGLPYPELSHRTTRFAVILPVALAQLILGSHPNVYYVLPLLNSAAAAAIAFLIGSRLRGRLAGFLAGLGVTLFPYMARAGSQVRPETFSITYILLTLLFFLDYIDRKERELPPLIWTAVWLFIAYEAKITNLFFLPGLLLSVLLYKRKLSHAFLLGGILLALFLIETGAYAAFTEYKFGELEIITRSHTLSGEPLVVGRFVDLFQRYSSSRLQFYWQAPFLLFAAAAAFYLAKRTSPAISALAIAGLSFFLCITFEVSSLKPIMPAEPFINRYFCSVLGPVFLVLGIAANDLLRRFGGRRLPDAILASPRVLVAILSLGAIGTLATFSFPRLPEGMRSYANSPLRLGSHPLALNELYQRRIDEALAKGIPIVAAQGIAGGNALSTCEAFFVGIGRYEGGRPPSYAVRRIGNGDFLVLGGADEKADTYLAAMRAPFRVAFIGRDALGALSADFLGGAEASKADADDQ